MVVNGFAEKTGWVDRDDGLLVVDWNNNDLIDNGSELFGNSTLLTNSQKATKDVFTTLTDGGALSSDFFRTSTNGVALDENDYFLYNSTSGALFYNADGNGQDVAVQFATLTTKPVVTATDFITTS